MKNIQPHEFFPKGTLKGKTLFISGASRGNKIQWDISIKRFSWLFLNLSNLGIGLAIGLRAARDGKYLSLNKNDVINIFRSQRSNCC